MGLANPWGPRRLPWFPEPHHAPLWLLDSTAHVGVRVPVWEPPLNRPSPAWGGHRGVAAAGHRASRAPSAGAEWLRLVAPGAVACVRPCHGSAGTNTLQLLGTPAHPGPRGAACPQPGRGCHHRGWPALQTRGVFESRSLPWACGPGAASGAPGGGWREHGGGHARPLAPPPPLTGECWDPSSLWTWTSLLAGRTPLT